MPEHEAVEAERARQEAGQGEAFAVLLLSEWLHRRVETVSVLDDERVRRRVTIDFTIPEYAWEVNLPSVPLAYLRKEPLVGFDLRDRSDHPLPMLTKTESGRLEARALQALAPLHIDLGLLQAIAEAPRAEAEVLSRELQDQYGWDIRSPFNVLLERFAASFALFVPAVHGRQIVKFSYLEELEKPPARDPVELRVMAPAPAMGGSVHLELEAPRELEIVQRPLSQAWRSRQVGRSVHFYLQSQHGATQSSLMQDEPEAPRVCFILPRRGLMRIALVLALAVAALVGFVAALLTTPTSAGGVSILLALPGLYGIVLARPEEHSLASYILGHLRILLLCHLAIPLVMATYLAVVPPWSYDRTVTWGMALLAASSTLGIVAARERLRQVPHGSEAQ